MAAITTIAIPAFWLQALLPDYDIRAADMAWVKSAVSALLKQRVLSPPPEEGQRVARDDVSPKVTVNISIADPAGGILMKHASLAGVSLGIYCKRLLATCPDAEVKDEIDKVEGAEWLAEILSRLHEFDKSMGERTEQSRHFVQLQDALNNGRIGLCEAGTGTGKTLAMLAAASQIAQSKQARCLISVPTVALLGQFSASYEQLLTLMPGLPRLRTVLGRREFVSPERVQWCLTIPEFVGRIDADAVNAWLREGGPSRGSVKRTWLASTLVQISPDFPIEDAGLNEVMDVADAGFQSYRRQFEVDRECGAEVVLATHAMLAADLRSRLRIVFSDPHFKVIDEDFWSVVKRIHLDPGPAKAIKKAHMEVLSDERGKQFADLTFEDGLMPGFQYAIVDEGHLLEQNVSNALSEYVALRQVRADLDKYRSIGGRFGLGHVQEVEKCIQAISELGRTATEDLVTLSKQAPVNQALVAELHRLMTALDRFPAKVPERASAELAVTHRHIKRAIAIIRAAISGSGAQSYLQFSPVRQYPQLFVGRSSVESVLRNFWESLHAGAAVSATLYIPKGELFSGTYMAGLLGMPSHRVKEYPPVAPSWLITTVESLWVPAARVENGQYWLRPPSAIDKDKDPQSVLNRESLWHSQVADAIRWIDRTRAGGMLVLCTSYRTCLELSRFLSDIESPVITATTRMTVNMQVSAFLAQSHAGKKPIWLATGAAWTGLDVGGHEPWKRLFGAKLDASVDNVITDLVIPRFPYGTNRTITHQYRLAHRPNVPWELLETAFRLRQGIGRLVRRMGLPRNRRIFVLDGRLNDPIFGSAFALLKKSISRYPSRTFDRETECSTTG